MEYPSLFREESFLLETGLRYEKRHFTLGYGDQHTHCLPAGAFLHSERLQQHRFRGEGLKGEEGNTCSPLSIPIYVYK